MPRLSSLERGRAIGQLQAGVNNSTWQDGSGRYIDEILRPVVVPYVQNMGQGAFFQDDNC